MQSEAAAAKRKGPVAGGKAAKMERAAGGSGSGPAKKKAAAQPKVPELPTQWQRPGLVHSSPVHRLLNSRDPCKR